MKHILAWNHRKKITGKFQDPRFTITNMATYQNLSNANMWEGIYKSSFAYSSISSISSISSKVLENPSIKWMQLPLRGKYLFHPFPFRFFRRDAVGVLMAGETSTPHLRLGLMERKPSSAQCFAVDTAQISKGQRCRVYPLAMSVDICPSAAAVYCPEHV